MSKKSKNILLIFFILYVITVVISVISLFDIEALKEITKLDLISIPMGTMILLAYAHDKGERGLCFAGIICLIVSTVFTLLHSYEVVDYSYAHSDNMTSNLVQVGDLIASGGLSICSVLALLSLIPVADARSSMFKVVCVIGYVLYILTGAVNYLTDVTSMVFLTNVRYLSLYASHLAEYAFIVFYLLGKNEDLVKEIKQENPILAGNQMTNPPLKPELNSQPIESVVEQGPVMQQPVMNSMDQPIMQPEFVQQPEPMDMQPVMNEPQMMQQQPVMETIPQPVVEQAEPVVQQPEPVENVIPQIVMPTTNPQ